MKNERKLVLRPMVANPISPCVRFTYEFVRAFVRTSAANEPQMFGYLMVMGSSPIAPLVHSSVVEPKTRNAFRRCPVFIHACQYDLATLRRQVNSDRVATPTQEVNLYREAIQQSVMHQGRPVTLANQVNPHVQPPSQILAPTLARHVRAQQTLPCCASSAHRPLSHVEQTTNERRHHHDRHPCP